MAAEILIELYAQLACSLVYWKAAENLASDESEEGKNEFPGQLLVNYHG